MANEEMIKCSCGLIVASSKMGYHLEAEHLIKTVSNILEGAKK